MKTVTKRILLGLVVIALSAGSLFANLVTVQLVQNGNFQSGQCQSGINGPGVFTGITNSSPCSINSWKVTGTVDWIGTFWSAPNSPGHSLDLGGSSAAGTMSQTITTVAGQAYTLTFYLSGNVVGPPLQKSRLLEVSAADSGHTFKTDDYTTFKQAQSTLPNSGWELETFLFTAQSGQTTISFESKDTIKGSSKGVNFGPAVAGVSVLYTTNTPEPGFYGVLALGLAGLFFVVRRRRSA